MYIRSCLLVAFGVAAGITAASLSPRPATPPPPPQIEVRTGHVERSEALHPLLPQSIRVGDQITRLGSSGPAGSEKALVYLDVNGVPVIIALAVGPGPGVTPPPSDPSIRVVPADGVRAKGSPGTLRKIDFAPAALIPGAGCISHGTEQTGVLPPPYWAPGPGMT
jgi:hypothetical protein